MCGIAGIYNFAQGPAVEAEAVKSMCAALTHRGPDDEGFYFGGDIGLGHRRLSIIDIDGGRQPISNEDGTLWIICNGEIYNFRELNKGLRERGHIFKTRSDTETVLHLYEEEGVGCLDKLKGMFSFAIWDGKQRSLFLARDRLGKKPLHYALTGGHLVFASEIKAVLRAGSIDREIDPEALHDYLSLIYVPAPNTMFKGIKKLPAGHYMMCGRDKVEIKRYWDIDLTELPAGGEDELARAIHSKLKEAVRSRMISDVPLGAFLSGGVDSSSVVSLMSELQDEPVITNSVGFPVKGYDELEYARMMSEKCGSDHHEYRVEPDALGIIDDLGYFFDEPFGDASSIPTYYVSKMARQNVKVALSGDGGDESFAGYKRYADVRYISAMQAVLPGMIKSLARSAGNGMARRGGVWPIKTANKLEEFYLPPFDIYFKMISMYKEKEKNSLYGNKLKKAMRGYSTLEKYRKVFDSCRSDELLSKFQYLDIKTYLCDDILVKVDRASMANSLEVRCPLLDHEFMQYAASLPASLKYRGTTGKYILKKAFSKTVPRRILARKKMGFAVPMAHWLANDLRTMVEKELFAADSIIRELFDADHVLGIWHSVLRGDTKWFLKADLSYRIWVLFVLSRWHTRYIKNA
jgi:asparagine synthase (glutamine-hydrolysing)